MRESAGITCPRGRIRRIALQKKGPLRFHDGTGVDHGSRRMAWAAGSLFMFTLRYPGLYITSSTQREEDFVYLISHGFGRSALRLPTCIRLAMAAT